MKNTWIRLLALVLALACFVGVIAACGGDDTTAPASSESTSPEASAPTTSKDETENPTPTEFVDYVSQLTLDETSSSPKAKVTVKTFVDGDTTHFNIDKSVMGDGVLKARYAAINTPESTGDVEPFGKKAANFTKEILSKAAEILVESENPTWEHDSTGYRYMSWVWYKQTKDGPWRNLNLEILQNGLALASNTAGSRYGDICMKALNQAKQHKLVLYSGEKDPDFYYGDAREMTLKVLRTSVEALVGQKVAFEGVVTKDNSNTVYVEEYDPETDMYYGMTVYYGYNLSGEGLSILKVGNRVRIVGTVQFYEAGGTYQVSGLTYRAMKPNDPGNIQKVDDEHHDPAFRETDAKTFAEGKVDVTFETTDEEGNVTETTTTYDYAALAMSTSLSMKGLKVVSVYTTTNEDSSSQGAMTLTCEKDGVTVDVRTVVLFQDGKLVTEDAFKGKTIDVRGIVDYFNGSYQIKVFSMNDITVTD